MQYAQELLPQAVQLRHYIQQPLSREELAELIDKLQEPAHQLIRNADKLALSKPLAELSKEEIIEVLMQAPHLLQRPILIDGAKAYIARPPEKVQSYLTERY